MSIRFGYSKASLWKLDPLLTYAWRLCLLCHTASRLYVLIPSASIAWMLITRASSPAFLSSKRTISESRAFVFVFYLLLSLPLSRPFRYLTMCITPKVLCDMRMATLHQGKYGTCACVIHDDRRHSRQEAVGAHFCRGS